MTFNPTFLCASLGFSQNLATVRTVHATSHRCRPRKCPPYLAEWKLNISLCSSVVGGSSAFERVGTPEEAGILHAFSTLNVSTTDFTYYKF